MTILHLTNDTDAPFWGWQRCNVDVLPNFRYGGHPKANWLLGKQSGRDTWHVDVWAVIQAGERLVLDLNEGHEAGRFIPPPPIDDNFLGGLPVTIGGIPMKRLSAEVEGGGYNIHYRAKVGATLNVDLFLTWWPDQLEWCIGEILITASNPMVPDRVGTIPNNFVLKFGDASVLVPGLPTDAPLMVAGDWLADAQSRILPLVLCWTRHGGDLSMCRHIAEQKIQMRGIAKLHPDGNPRLPAGFNAVAWTRSVLPEVVRVIHTWENSFLDPSFVSGATGAQGSQSFVGGPAMADASAIGPLYIAALDCSWPLFHLEADGSQLDWKGHPGLKMWYGRVNRPISTDILGKPEDPNSFERHGYSGPEGEHDFDFVLWAAARLKGTPALQWLLSAHARLWLFTATLDPAWSFPNRCEGWWGFKVAEIVTNLQDRELAEAVAERFRVRFDTIVVPHMWPDNFWSWKNDPRIGPGIRAIPWQAAVFALGCRAAGIACSSDGAYSVGIQAAEQVLSRAWTQHNGRWTSRDVICQDGSDPGPYLGAYDFFGMPMCVGAVLLHNPTHGTAGAIWTQLVQESTALNQCSWLAPGVVLS